MFYSINSLDEMVFNKLVICYTLCTTSGVGYFIWKFIIDYRMGVIFIECWKCYSNFVITNNYLVFEIF